MTVTDALFDVEALHAAALVPGSEVELAPLLGAGGRRFTPAQARAVCDRSRSLLLTAAAGSGKTAVLVERFARAVVEEGVDPARVLAITFTEKAAGELRERVRARLLELGARDAARATEAAYVSTIHGFCARLLRAHALAAGIDPAFSVLDDARAGRLREHAFERALASFLAGPGRDEALDLVAAYGPERLRAMVVETHEALRSEGATAPRLPRVPDRGAPEAERAALCAAHVALAAELAPARDGKVVGAAREALDRCGTLLAGGGRPAVPRPSMLAALRLVRGNAAALRTDAGDAYAEARDAYERACADHHAVRAVAWLDDLLGAFGHAYVEAKRERGVLDFDDLELLARDLLVGHPALRREWRERFALVMVDEFQDCNRRQLTLLDALDDGNVFTVGDELQSIYGFRHADVSIFRERRSALAGHDAALELRESFRARPEVLAAVNAAFTGRLSGLAPPLVAGRDEVPASEPRVELLVTAGAGWEERGLPGVPSWRDAEARLVAHRVRELVDAGEAQPGEVAVLARTAAALPPLERALGEVGLPTLTSAGRGFWTRQEIVDLGSYLAVLANPLDEVALVSVLASPLAGASADALALAARATREQRRDLWWTLRAAFAEGEEDEWTRALDEIDRRALAAFVVRFARERERASGRPLDELLERAVAASGYDVHVLGRIDGARRMANVHKLARVARDFEAAEGRDLRGFVDHLRALEQVQPREPDAPLEDPAGEAVRLMTIHAAKGLEFDVVVVADLGRRTSCRTPDLLVAGGRVGLRLAGLGEGTTTPALGYEELREARRRDEAEEEDRVLYVALTRARERLLLAGAADERWATAAPGAAPLSWLGPALVPDLAARLAAATAGAGEAEASLALPGRAGVRLRLVLATPATADALGLAPDGELPGADASAAAVRPTGAPPAAAVLATGAPPAPAVRGPAAPGGAPSPRALSYTALSAYGRCGLRFQAQRVLGLPDVSAPRARATQPSRRPDVDASASRRGPAAGRRSGLDARGRGVLVHALLEELDLTAAGPRLPAEEHVRTLARRLGEEPTDADVARVARLVAAFACSPVAARLARATTLGHERELAFELRPGAGPLLTGVVDVLAVERDGGWLVVDAKTEGVGEADDLASLVEREYGVQRRLYALAVLRAGAQRVEVAHVFLERGGEAVAAHYGPADEPALVAELAVLCDGVAAARFDPTEAPHAGLCATCPARGTLCPHPRELTLRPASALRGSER